MSTISCLTRPRRYAPRMCRSIRQLRRADEAGPATTGEARAAALQYVRKISGYREPSARNADAFRAAVEEIAHATQHLLEALGHRRRRRTRPVRRPGDPRARSSPPDRPVPRAPPGSRGPRRPPDAPSVTGAAPAQPCRRLPPAPRSHLVAPARAWTSSRDRLTLNGADLEALAREHGDAAVRVRPRAAGREPAGAPGGARSRRRSTIASGSRSRPAPTRGSSP